MQHVVSNTILTQIGDITVSFAMLESQIRFNIWMMIAEPQRVGQIITAELSFKNLRALMISLYKEKYGSEDEKFKDLKTLMARAGALEDKRNQITHSTWAGHKDENAIHRMKMTAQERRGFHFAFEEMREDDFVKIAADLKQLTADIQDFWTSLYIQSHDDPDTFDQTT